jgi:hypothetical protein
MGSPSMSRGTREEPEMRTPRSSDGGPMADASSSRRRLVCEVSAHAQLCIEFKWQVGLLIKGDFSD